jgi:hypothetical protein
MAETAVVRASHRLFGWALPRLLLQALQLAPLGEIVCHRFVPLSTFRSIFGRRLGQSAGSTMGLVRGCSRAK